MFYIKIISLPSKGRVIYYQAEARGWGGEGGREGAYIQWGGRRKLFCNVLGWGRGLKKMI